LPVSFSVQIYRIVSYRIVSYRIRASDFGVQLYDMVA